MKQIFDTDAILFSLLNKSAVKDIINGSIYVSGDRPTGSQKEDIVVDTIFLTQDFHPQIGTSVVNIYVPDGLLKIEGKQQKMANRVRMKELSGKVLEVLREAMTPGLKIFIESQNVLAETAIEQHFVNIRVGWNIQK